MKKKKNRMWRVCCFIVLKMRKGNNSSALEMESEMINGLHLPF